ncbi:MAG: hypothetical protein FJW96_15645 [Actinobacteria bacterium]|nr:hypothetical protein [Actinomycetota bacterium]
MLVPEDRLEVPTGVVLRDGKLEDVARGATVAVNPAAAVVLRAGGRPLREIARDLEVAFAIDAARARDDVLRFAWQLNGLGLANVRHHHGRLWRGLQWLRLALRLLPSATLPPSLTRRLPLDTTTSWRALAGVVRALVGRALLLAAVAVVVLMPVAAVGGARSLVLAGALGASAGLALIAHETAHALALVRASPAAIVVSWRRISVIHAELTPRRRTVVAAAGPLLPATFGLAIAALAVVVRLPELAVGAAPLAGHAVGLTVITSDGRRACGI